MKIKRLELNGFKSFRDKTVIHFTEGITGIVGPNGCGKSNVVDAFFWVLGEINPRTLRGQAMDDLIFSGSEKSPPSGMAEVHLTIETEFELHGPNAPAGASVRDYALRPEKREIAVTRRLYRNGDSEYLINKLPCRLRDIQEIFLDTGTGSRGYSIIQQGKIAEIVNAKSDERREIIENVAGVTKYKHRRREATRKIDTTKQNLLRVTDLLNEMEKQKKQMERQAAKARKYTQWKEELQTLDLFYSSIRWEKLMEESNNIQTNITNLEEENASLIAERGIANSTHSQKKLELTAIEKISEELQTKLFRESKNLSDNESELRYQEKTREDAETATLRLEKEKSVEESRIEEFKTSIEKEENLYKDNKTNCKSLSSLREARNQEVEEEKLKLKEFEEKAEENQESFLEIEKKLFQIKEQINSSKKREERLKEKVCSIIAKEEEINKNKEKLIKDKNMQDTNIKEEEEKQLSLEERIKFKSTFMQEQQKELKLAYEKLTVLERKKVQLNSKLLSLKEQKKRLEGHSQAVKTIFQDILPENPVWKANISGPLLSQISIQRGKEAIVEAALGDSINLILSECPDIPLKLAKSLRTLKGGHASFAILSQLKEEKKIIQKPKEKPILEFLSSPPKFQALLEQLLEGFFFIPEEESAKALAMSYPECSFITKEASLYRQAFLSAGDRSFNENSILKREEAIKSLEKAEKEIEEKLTTYQSSVEKKERDSSLHNTEKETLLQKLQEQSKVISSLITTHVRLSVKLESLDNAQKALKEKQDKHKKELESIDSANRKENNKLQELKTKKENLESIWREAKEKLPELREHSASIQKKLTEIQVKEAAALEQRNTSNEKLNAYRNSLQYTEEHLENLCEQIKNQKTTKEKLLDSSTDLKEKIKRKKLTVAELQGEYAKAQDKLDFLQKEAEVSLDSSNKAAQEELKLRDNLNSFRIQLERLEMEKESLSQNTKERYEIELEEHQLNSELQKNIAEFSEKNKENYEEAQEELKENITKLKAKIRNLGEVHTGAMEEYDELMGRFELLSEQRQDLETAMENLRETIQKINRISKERFFRTFNEVNKQFSNVFPAMFGGGQAELKLTEPTNFLETGVDIMSQPPGKKLQNISLLSGGEKTLAAISLLFAIFLVKPSPFCLLDEVDAPLDDANIGRFNSFLKEMSRKTQFIIITHNKRTMELNDKLYGVTMENAGISKMLSIQMT